MDISLAREALYYASELGDTKDYAFILFALDANTVWANTSLGDSWLDGKFPGESENITESLKKAFESSLVIAMNPLRTSQYETFVSQLKTKTKDPPTSSSFYEGAGSSKEVITPSSLSFTFSVRD